MEILERSGFDDLGLERLREHRDVAPDRIDSRQDLIDVGARRTGGNGIIRRIRHGGRGDWWSQRDRDVAKDTDRLDDRCRAFRDLILVVDAEQDVEITIPTQRDIADVPDTDAGEQDRLSL